MNKKGFTLTELLAVIVILAIVSTIGIVSVTGVKKQINNKLFTDKLSEVIASAENYGDDNKDLLINGSYAFTLDTLIKTKYFETDEDIELSKYTKCASENKEGSKCKNVVVNNIDDIVINDLELEIKIKNKRVYGCIKKTDNNKKLLNEDDNFTKYDNLNLYC